MRAGPDSESARSGRGTTADPRRPARRTAYPIATGLRCDLRCSWSDGCRGPTGPTFLPGSVRLELPTDRAILLRLEGGDPIAHADLDAWGGWARGFPHAEIEIEGPGHALSSPERLDALRAANVGRARVVVPTIDRALFGRITGREDLLEPALLGIEAALAAGLEVECVVPVGPSTIGTIGQTLRGLAERFRGAASIVLGRAPDRRAPDGARIVPAGDWSELDALGEVLASLPATLPGGAIVSVDERTGYAPCLLPERAWRPDLFPVTRAAGERRDDELPVPEICATCAFRPRCAFRVRDEPPPRAHLRPLGEREAAVLEARTAVVDVVGAGNVRIDRAAHGLPEMLCFAPWTTLTLYSVKSHPVPCAPAWVDTSLSAREASSEMGVSVPHVLFRDLVTRARHGVKYHDPTNESWRLGDMWNGPLYRQMRREMAPGGKSHRCRASCRVVLGVEERGTGFFVVPDADLSPGVVRNRARLLDEIREGRSVLESTPLELTIGVSAHCNFSCGFCTGPQGSYGELSEARYEEVKRWLPGLMQLSVVGPGEPLMSVTFKKLLEHIATEGYPSLGVSLTTNGTLARPSWLRRHAGIRWTHLRFSINSGSAATHERMTGKKLFGQLIENVEAAVELRDRREPPFTFVLSCVLSELVAGDLGRYAELVDKYQALPVLEPMTGNLGGLSPYVDEKKTRRLRDECAEVAAAWRGKNQHLHDAFDAMARFASDRLAAGEYDELPNR